MLSALIFAASLLQAAEPVKNPDTFVLAEIGDVGSLDPAFPYDGPSQSLIQNVYETLIAFKGSSLSEFEPRISEKVPSLANGLVSKDGRTYRFPIRKGVKFQDGSEVTAEDVRYSLLRFMLQDRAGGPSALLLEPIAGMPSTRDSSGTIKLDFAALEKNVRVDGQSVVITLPRPYGPFLSVMARWSYVLSKSWCASQGDWDGSGETWKNFNNPAKEKSPLYEKMNGAGPFKLSRWDRTARMALLERHDGYWRGPAKLRRVLIKAVPELGTRKLMIQAGDADLIETPRPHASLLEGIPGVKLVDGLTRLQTDPAILFTVAINPVANPDIGSGKLDGDGVPPDFFADVDVRKGFAHSFDYDAIRRDTFKNTAKRAIGPIPPGVPGHDAKAPRYEFDLKKAEQHLRKAHGGQVWEKGFKFTLTYNKGSETREAAAQILKKGVEKLNPKFRIDLRGVEWGNFVEKAQRRLMPVFVRGWYGDYPDAHNFVYAFLHSQGAYPSAQAFRDEQLDKMIEAASAEPSPGKRAEAYRKILARGHELSPAIYTVHPVGVYAMREWVKGFVDNAVNIGIYYYPIEKK